MASKVAINYGANEKYSHQKIATPELLKPFKKLTLTIGPRKKAGQLFLPMFYVDFCGGEFLMPHPPLPLAAKQIIT